MKRASSPVLATRRTLCIIRALQREPLDRAALEARVREVEGVDAYTDDNPTAVRKAFEGDLERAYEQFGVTIRYDHQHKVYRIADVIEAGWLDLPDETLDALALIYQTFDEDAPEAAKVRRALDGLLTWLPTARRQNVQRQQRRFDVELRDLDPELDSTLRQKLEQAIERRRVLRFVHRSPRHPRQQAISYEVEPYEVRHREGHWYLLGFVRWAEGDDGRDALEAVRRFRLSYVDPDSVEILSEKLSITPRPRRPFLLRYRLHPDIARGDISHRFDKTEVRHEADGWAEVTAQADDPFYVAQQLFRYADKCVVLEPPAVVEMIRSWIWGMMELYVEPTRE